MSTRENPGREAGFRARGEEDLARLVAAELAGVAESPRLLSSVGPWVAFRAREPFYGARIVVCVRPRDALDELTTEHVLAAAGSDRDVLHPAALSVREFGCTEQLLWVATPEHRGRLLSHWYGPGIPRARPAAVAFLRYAAPPLASLHAAGIVHGALGTSAFHRGVDGVVRVRGIGVDLPIVRFDAARGRSTET
ncbi:MAG TPA: hypothetical protein VFQ22_12090, partial [Longimicrobiales bacterium]|nr:hypothetical protein [Longimicrobiales bacterium]